MMKKFINSIWVCLITLAMFAVGCSKTGGSGSVPAPPIPPPIDKSPPSAPLTITVAADTALFNGPSTLRITTDGQSTMAGSKTVANGVVTFDSLTKDTTINIVSTNTNAYGSSAKTIAFTIKVWSKRTTQVNNIPPHHFISSKSCIAGTENSPNVVWINFDPAQLPCDSYKLFANGGGLLIYGPCRVSPNVPGTVFVYSAGKAWHWADANETKMDFGDNIIWDITLNPTGFTRTKTNNGSFMVDVFSQ